MEAKRKILVNADALALLLARVDPAGFMSNELGVCYVNDPAGVTSSRLEAQPAENDHAR